MKRLRPFLAFAIFVAILVLSQQIISRSFSNQVNKIESAELNHIKYGIFSVNKWKEQLSVVIAQEINKLSLTQTNQKQLKKHVEIQLEGLIENVNSKIQESNKGTFKGWMKQSFINAFVNIQDIKAGIPGYADTIISELTKQETQKEIKKAVKGRIAQYFDKTYDAQDLSRLNLILERTESPNPDAARSFLSEEIATHEKVIKWQTWLVIALAVGLFLIAGFRQVPLPPTNFILMLLALLALLATGVTTPMIDMEAKISQMSFFLLDHPIHFENQVLYFQSKSILDVFWIMVTHESVEMKIVGILMVVFSIVFPLLKMISSLGYYYNYRNARNRWWVQFFVLKSGKWSMTDVQIVAIFMAYIGFNGVITSQFGKLKEFSDEIVMVTTNGTALQPGFYIFLTYTILALFLSGFLIRDPKLQPALNPQQI